MSAVAYPSTAEYDAFGPWIDEVTTADEVPRLYRDVAIDFAAAHTVLKFPRPIARRMTQGVVQMRQQEVRRR